MPRAAVTKPPIDTSTRKRGVNKGGDIATARKRGRDTGTLAEAAKIDPNKPLTEMQKAFVKNWAAGESILTASARAGYADGGSFAYRMVAMPNILQLYNAEKAAYEKAGDLSRKKVMDMLKHSYDCAEMAGEPASMVSAARELGKMAGYYEPVKHRIDVNVSGEVIHKRMSSLTDAQLLEIITSGKALEVVDQITGATE